MATVFGLLTACSGPPLHEFTPDAGPEPITIHGRIVDFESCASWNRCTPVEGLMARLHRRPSYVSEPSGRPGRFELPSPPAYEDDILVDPGAYGMGYARTLNPWAAPAAYSDVFEVELFVMPVGRTAEGNDTLLTALANGSPSINLVGDSSSLGEGGYIGQVLRRDEEGLHAVNGARVELVLPSDWPATAGTPDVLFVSVLPRFSSDSVLYPSTYTATGPLGIFVIPTRDQSALITVRVYSGDTIFREIIAPVEPGMVTLGLHTP